jgi:uracil-DNA glycosylase
MSVNLTERIPNDWKFLLADYLQDKAWFDLCEKFASEYALHQESIRPNIDHLFRALELCSVTNTQVIILGQDPYHSPGLAQGLAFSIPKEIPVNSKTFPSSLRNIRKALCLEGFGLLPHGDLSHWAQQGVLLLNTALSVRLGQACSHTQLGWATLIQALIRQLSKSKPNLVWLLWGAHAQSNRQFIQNQALHCILEASHPSGLSVYKTQSPFLTPGDRGSCACFQKTNEWLEKHQKKPISWVF